MNHLSLLPYVVVATLATWAVLNHCYRDTLIQRIGLSGVSMGAVLRIAAAAQGVNPEAACTLMTYGIAIFSVGTVIKLKKAGKL